tara:strand:- start:924 stop:1316 length:393 start_codon:yes stop_codon:yes gene_type:complete
MDKHMPQDTLSFIQRIQEYGILAYVAFLFLSMWAGTVSFFKDESKNKLSEWVVEMVISSFVGLVTGLACQYYEVDVVLACVVTSISAMNGTKSLEWLADFLKKKHFNAKELHDEPVMVKVANRKGDENDS